LVGAAVRAVSAGCFAVSARIGVETRQGLVDLLRTNYGQTAAILCAWW